MNTKSAQVVLNFLPPASPGLPSASLSILKGFLRHHSVASQIVYWNLMLEKHLFPYIEEKDRDNEQLRLLPFCMMLAEQYADEETLKRIFSLVRAYHPSHQLAEPDYAGDIMNCQKQSVMDVFEKKLDSGEFQNTLLFGFTSKFHQWIPAAILAGLMKQRYPHAGTVIGGLDTPDAADALLRIFPQFDYAIWGEGEYPLLRLAKNLAAGKTDPAGVERLVYRSSNSIMASKAGHHEFLDYDHYILPDYEDYFSDPVIAANKEIVELPVNSIRGCRWNRCRFCVLSKGYKYRERSPESIVDEIRNFNRQYGIRRYQFVDNDITGKSKKRFGDLLDELIDFNLRCDDEIEIYAEIVPKGLNRALIRKMAAAGIRRVQLGYEALTDPLLRNMDKMGCLADNILTVKFCIKYGISVDGANLIHGVPGETGDDVRESAANLHFMRFFMGPGKIIHNDSTFSLDKHSLYYSMLNAEERSFYQYNGIYNIFPKVALDENEKFDLFYFSRYALINHDEWVNFRLIEKFYYESPYRYTIREACGSFIYEEFSGDDKTNLIVFNEPVNWKIMCVCNDEVKKMDEVFTELKMEFPSLTKKILKEKIEELKKEFLVYFDEHSETLVSIIDTGDAL